MVAIDINTVSYSSGEITVGLTAENDTNQTAEVSGSVGGEGFDGTFGPTEIQPNTVSDYEAKVPVGGDVVGENALVTASISETGVNTGDYPSKSEQRYVTVKSSGNVEIGGPEFGGGGSIEDGNSGLMSNKKLMLAGLGGVGLIVMASSRGNSGGK